MLWAKKYECSDRSPIYKYIGEHSYHVEHANNSYRKISIIGITSLCVNIYRDVKGPNVKGIQRDMFWYCCYSSSYWKCWKEGVVSNEMVWGAIEIKYSYLPVFSYIMKTLNVDSGYSIMVNGDNHNFMYYLLAFGSCIRDLTKYRELCEGMLFSVILYLLYKKYYI